MAAATQTLSNSDARLLFLNSAIRKSQFISPAQTPSLGSTLTFVLPKAGVGRGILLTVSLPISIVSTAQIPSAKNVFSIFNNIRLTDYSGVDRVNSSGWGLYLLSILKKDDGWEPSSGYPYSLPGAQNTTSPYVAATMPFGVAGMYSPQSSTGGGANTFSATNRWSIPTAIANPTSVVFSLWIPIAFGWNDPRGALLLNVPNGQVQLQLTMNSVLTASSGVDQLYTTASGTVALASPSTSNVVATVYYWDPIAVPGVPTNEYPGGIPIPYQDLQLVHEVRSFTDPTGFAASTEKQYVLTTGRDYYRVISSIVENGTFNSSHVSRIRFIYDGNTATYDEYTAAHQARVQMETGRELPEGVFYYDFSKRPFDSNSYGQLAIGTTVSSSFSNTSPTYQEIITDALYMATMSAA